MGKSKVLIIIFIKLSYKGVGRRGGTLSSLILAVLKDKSDLDNPQFMSFTKVSVGKQENINKLFDDITKWKDYDPKKSSPR